MPSEVGVVTNPYTNVGRMRSSGVDGNIYLNQKIDKDNSFTVRANMTYAVSKVVTLGPRCSALPLPIV